MAFVAPILGAYMSFGGFTTAFGYAVGGMFISNLISPSQKVKGPRLESLIVQSSDYGQPIPVIYGEHEIAGNIIWSTGIEEMVKKSGGGGSLGPGSPETTEYSYKTNMQIQFCVAAPTGYEIVIERIKANETVMMDETGNSPDDPDDKKGKKHNFIPWKFTQNPTTKVMTEEDGTVRIYLGTENQPADSAIVADKGANRATANRGTVTLVLENFYLGDFGNQPPTVRMLVKCTMIRADHICADICKRVGLTTPKVDFSQISANYFEGFAMNNRGTAKSYLEQIGQAVFCDFTEVDGKLTAIKRGQQPVVIMDKARVSAYTEQGENPIDTDYSRAVENELPRMIEVSFIDTKRDFNMNTRGYEKQVCDSNKKSTMSLNMSMSGARAENIAEIELFRLWQESETYTITAGWDYAYLVPGDAVQIHTPQGLRTVRITAAKETFFGVFTYTAVSYEPDGYNVQAGSETGDYEPPLVVKNGRYHYGLIPANSVVDDVNEMLGVYFWATSQGKWARTYAKNSLVATGKIGVFGGFKDDKRVGLKYPATAGPCYHVLGDTTVGSDVPDTVNTLIVDVYRDELESVTDDELAEGANAAFVGSELIQFRDAIFIDTVTIDGYEAKRFEISHLYRGRRGTEQYIGTHQEGETFVLVDEGVAFVPLKPEALGRDLEFVVDIPGDKPNIPADVTVGGENLKPYSPSHVYATITDGDVTLNWTRRSRYTENFFNSGIEPILGEKVESYEVDLLDSFGAPITTIKTTSPTLTISESEFAGYYPDFERYFTVVVYQMSEVVGRGYPAKVTIDTERL